MVKVVAKTGLTYGGKRYSTGDTINMKSRDARVMLLIRRVGEYVEPPPPPAPASTRTRRATTRTRAMDEPTAPPTVAEEKSEEESEDSKDSSGTYHRRDMRAE